MTEIDGHLPDEALNEYLDSEMGAAERARAEAHLAACAECSTRLEELRALFDALAGAPQEHLSKDLAGPVLSAVQVGHAPRRMRWGMALAAIIQVVISTAALALLPPASTWLAALKQVSASTGQALQTGWLPAQSVLEALDRAQQSAQDALTGGLSPFNSPLRLSLPPALELGLILGIGALLWLAGNGLLLNIHKTPARGGMHG
jgi:anti-sigma factor RsiW